MTREEAKGILEEIKINDDCLTQYIKGFDEALEMAIEALEQDTVPFDFELYQAGLMDMPKGIIEVLDKIRAEIEQLTITKGGDDYVRQMAELFSLKRKVLQIIDKYKAESEDRENEPKNEAV